MTRMYKIGNLKVNECGLECIYLILDELRRKHIHCYDYYMVLTCCMEEVAKRSKRLKASVERYNMKMDKEKEVEDDN